MLTEQNREPRNKSTLYSKLMYDKTAKKIQRKKGVSSMHSVIKTGQPYIIQKKGTKLLSYITDKYYLEMD